MNTATDIPRTMRASVLVAQGQVRDDEQQVRIPADDEVLIKVASVGVCSLDVHYYREGRIGDFVVDAPLVLGHEASGRIVAVGAKVPDAGIGERVAIEPQRPSGSARSVPRAATTSTSSWSSTPLRRSTAPSRST